MIELDRSTNDKLIVVLFDCPATLVAEDSFEGINILMMCQLLQC